MDAECFESLSECCVMGQKVHPESMLFGYIHDWKSTSFSEKEFSDYLM